MRHRAGRANVVGPALRLQILTGEADEGFLSSVTKLNSSFKVIILAAVENEFEGI